MPPVHKLRQVLQAHRAQLEQQLEDIRVMLGEIGQHEQRCKRLLANLVKPTVRQ